VNIGQRLIRLAQWQAEPFGKPAAAPSVPLAATRTSPQKKQCKHKRFCPAKPRARKQTKGKKQLLFFFQLKKKNEEMKSTIFMYF